jgi:hypothetical protein
LKRHEIDERLEKIPIPDDKRPPAPSVNGMLSALAQFQRKNGIELLEWSEVEQRLYIIEPAFLFYLRWRENRQVPLSLKELLRTLLRLD